MSKISLEQFCINLLTPEADDPELSKLFIYNSMNIFNVKYLLQTAVVVLSWFNKSLSALCIWVGVEAVGRVGGGGGGVRQCYPVPTRMSGLWPAERSTWMPKKKVIFLTRLSVSSKRKKKNIGFRWFTTLRTSDLIWVYNTLVRQLNGPCILRPQLPMVCPCFVIY